MIVIKAYKENKDKILTFKTEDLLEKSIIDIVEVKTGQRVDADLIKVSGNKITIKQPSEPVVIEIDENELLKQSIETIVKKKMSVKTLKTIKIEVIGCKGK